MFSQKACVVGHSDPHWTVGKTIERGRNFQESTRHKDFCGIDQRRSRRVVDPRGKRGERRGQERELILNFWRFA